VVGILVGSLAGTIELETVLTHTQDTWSKEPPRELEKSFHILKVSGKGNPPPHRQLKTILPIVRIFW
jgi:hypothetical protein